MQCLNVRRRFLTKPREDPLIALFKDMSVVEIKGRNTSVSGYVGPNTPPSLNSTKYYIAIYNNRCTIWRIDRSAADSWTGTALLKTGTGVGINRSATAATLNNLYLRTASSFANGTGTGSSIYGGTLAEVSFPSYTNAEIDAILGDASITGVSGRNSSSTGTISTTSTTNKLLLAAKNAALDVLNGSTWEKISGTATDAATISTNISLGAVYGGSIIGIN